MSVDLFDVLAMVGTVTACASAVRLTGEMSAGFLILGCILVLFGFFGASRK